MPRRRHLSRLLLSACLLLVLACSSQPPSPTLIASIENPRYGLRCLYFGEGRTVTRVVLRDDRTGREEVFVPIDADSLSTSSGWPASPWSPDHQLLALPLGRFEGFLIFRAKTLIDDLRQESSLDSIRVEMDTGAMLWHDAMQWSGPDQLAFTAGLSGQQTPFVYDIQTKSLKSTEKLSSSFRAVNRNGMVSPTGAGAP